MQGGAVHGFAVRARRHHDVDRGLETPRLAHGGPQAREEPGPVAAARRPGRIARRRVALGARPRRPSRERARGCAREPGHRRAPAISPSVSGRVEIGAALTRGIIGTAGLRATQAMLTLLTAVVLARLLAPEGYGAYSFAIAIVAFLAIPSELGVPGLAVREIAVANARGDWPRMRAFIAWSHRNVAAVSLVV